MKCVFCCSLFPCFSHPCCSIASFYRIVCNLYQIHTLTPHAAHRNALPAWVRTTVTLTTPSGSASRATRVILDSQQNASPQITAEEALQAGSADRTRARQKESSRERSVSMPTETAVTIATVFTFVVVLDCMSINLRRCQVIGMPDTVPSRK